MTSVVNVIAHISSSAGVSLPLIRIRIGNDDAWTTEMNEESISLKQRRKRETFLDMNPLVNLAVTMLLPRIFRSFKMTQSITISETVSA